MSLRRRQSGKQNTNGEAGMSPTNRRQFLIQAAAALPLSAGLRTALGATDSGAQTDAVHSYGEELPDMLLSYIEKKKPICSPRNGIK